MRTSTRADSGLTLTRLFDMENENIYKSKKNANVYHIFDEKIVVKTSHGDKEIPLPVDPMSFKYYVSFYFMFYEDEKLFVVVIGRTADVRFEVDEDTLELKGNPIPWR